MAMDCSRQEPCPPLQKYKVKKIDLFSVTVTNSFLGERVGNKETPTPTSAKKYENPPSNQQISCVYTCKNPNCGCPCPGRSSIGIPGGIAARSRSADSAHTASDSKILESRRFRRIACRSQFATDCETTNIPAGHNTGNAAGA